jgi:uncharacterized protein (TIGR03083 family)
MEWSDALDALSAQYGAVTELLDSLDDQELLAPSGCRGWTNADLVFHMLLDAQRALVTFNSPSPGPADSDFVRYWEAFSAVDPSALAHARFVRISAAAHSEVRAIVNRWRETATAAVRCAKTLAGVEFVTTQGYTLRSADFAATLVVEATVHHLDLLENLAGKRAPASMALSLTRKTLDGLLGAPRPSAWDDRTYILKATGRAPLGEDDVRTLGRSARKLPVFS